MCTISFKSAVRLAAIPLLGVVFLSVLAAQPCMQNCTIQTSVGVFAVTGAWQGDRIPPGCNTNDLFCRKASPGYQVLIVWLDGQEPLTGSAINLLGSNIYIQAQDGAKTNVFSAGFTENPDHAVSEEFIAFTPRIDATGFVLYSGDSVPVDLMPLLGGAQAPVIAENGVVNGASFRPGIAPASWVTVQGTNLADTTRIWRADEIVDGNLPTQLDGVGVTINGRQAFVSYISPTQINVQSPSDDTLGPVTVEVVKNGVSSVAATANLQRYSPAFFLWQGLYSVATRPDFTLIGPPELFPDVTTTPAHPGDVVILWGTGFGPTTPLVNAGLIVTGAPSVVTNPVITVGGVQAQVISAVLSPGFAALYQIAIYVPEALSSGDHAVVATVDGISSPDNVFLTIQR